MPYVVKQNETYVLHKESDSINAQGDVIGEEHVSVRHQAGDVIADNELAAVVKRGLEEGNPHTCSVLEEVSDSDAEARSAALLNPLQTVLGAPASAYHLGGANQVGTEEAAEQAALGPEPLDVGPTGQVAAPGVIAPDAAALAAERDKYAVPDEPKAAPQKHEPKGKAKASSGGEE